MKAILLGVVASSLLVLTATPCLACSCVASTRAELFARADVVFTGIATESSDVETASLSSDVHFLVERVHKGDARTAAVVRAPTQGPACGVRFLAGDRYTVFALGSGDVLDTNVCAGTTAGTLDDVGDVEMHPPPVGGSGDVRPTSADGDPALGLALAAGVALAAAAAIYLRKRLSPA